jgi:uncharacterized protein (DUF433 family)
VSDAPIEEVPGREKRGCGFQEPQGDEGALVFKGTRVPVEILIQHLAAGDSLDEFLEGFPGVSREQVVAYLEMTPEAVDALIA